VSLVTVFLLLSIIPGFPPARAFEVGSDTIVSNPLSTDSHGAPRAAMDGDGNVHVVYSTRDPDTSISNLVYRKLSPEGYLLAGPTTVEPEDTLHLDSYDIIVAEDGRVHVVMSAMTAQQDFFELYYAQLDLDGSGVVSPTLLRSVTDVDARNTVMGVDARGNAYISWSEWEESHRIMWMRLSPEGVVLEPAEVVSASRGAYEILDHPDIAVVGAGTTFLAWHHMDIVEHPPHGSISFASLSSTGEVLRGPDTVLSNRYTSYEDPGIDVDSGGTLHMVFTYNDPVRDGTPGYARLDSHGSVLEETTLDDPSIGSTSDATVSVDIHDNVYVVYDRLEDPITDELTIQLIVYWDGEARWEGPQRLSESPSTYPDVATTRNYYSTWDYACVVYHAPANEIHMTTVGEFEYNHPPTPRLKCSPSGPEVGQLVTFDASGSSDPDEGDRVVAYLFQWGDGGDSGWTDSSAVTHSYSDPGSYSAFLHVRDSHGVASTPVVGYAKVDVGTTPANEPPTAVLTVDRATADVGETVTLRGGDSEDPDGTVEAFRFDFGDGEGTGWVSTPTAVHSYSREGAYTATLEVRDDEGLASPAATSARVTVVHVNLRPTASIVDVSPDNLVEGDEVTLTGAGHDIDGAVAGYHWESDIDGDLGDTATVTTSSLSAGTHVVSFKVRDDVGAWSEPATRTVVVTEDRDFVLEDLTPSRGSATEGRVRFRVLYTDPENEPPTRANLLYVGREGWRAVPLEEADPGDTDCTDGKEYRLTREFGVGAWSYAFEFENQRDPRRTNPEVEFVVEEESSPVPGWDTAMTMAAVAVVASLWASRTKCGERRRP